MNKKLLNVCTPILNQLIHRLLPETLNTIIILAGFLTYFAFEHPSHFGSREKLGGSELNVLSSRV